MKTTANKVYSGHAPYAVARRVYKTVGSHKLKEMILNENELIGVLQ